MQLPSRILTELPIHYLYFCTKRRRYFNDSCTKKKKTTYNTSCVLCYVTLLTY